MADLKLYDVFDMSPLRDYIREHGECRVYCKGECFCRIGENAPDIGVVNSGGFAFVRPDYKGDDQTCSLAFADELVGSYISMMPGRKSGFDVKALCKSEVSALALDTVVEYMDTISPDYRLRFTYAIAYAFYDERHIIPLSVGRVAICRTSRTDAGCQEFHVDFCDSVISRCDTGDIVEDACKDV